MNGAHLGKDVDLAFPLVHVIAHMVHGWPLPVCGVGRGMLLWGSLCHVNREVSLVAAEPVPEGGPVLEGFELGLGEGVVVGHLRPAMRGHHPEGGQARSLLASMRSYTEPPTSYASLLHRCRDTRMSAAREKPRRPAREPADGPRPEVDADH